MSQYPGSSSSSTAAAAAAAGSGSLVLIGFVIAVVAVLLMNIYVEMRVSARDEKEITLFRFAEDVDAGDSVSMNDLVPVKLPMSFQSAFGEDAIRESQEVPGTPMDGVNKKIEVSARAGEVLRHSQFLASSRRSSRNPPDPGEYQIALNVDSSKQPPNLAAGDFIDLYGSIPRNRGFETMVIMEYVEVAYVGERVVDSGDGERASKYGSVSINVKPEQVPLLFDIQRRIQDQEFTISLRAPLDAGTPATGKAAEINERVLQTLGLD